MKEFAVSFPTPQPELGPLSSEILTVHVTESSSGGFPAVGRVFDG